MVKTDDPQKYGDASTPSNFDACVTIVHRGLKFEVVCTSLLFINMTSAAHVLAVQIAEEH